MKRAERGYAVVWILVTIALFATSIGSIEFAVENREPNVVMFWVFGVGLAIAALGLFVEAKRELYAFCMFAAVFGVIAAIITGAVALLGTEPHPIAGAVAITTTLAVIACVAYMIKTQYGHDPLPNVLRQEFNRAAIYEVDGVQFAATQSGSDISAGEGFEIRVVAQNGWDTERTFIFGLKPERRISFNSARLVLEDSPSLTLAGGAAGVLSIPVIAEGKARGRYSLVAKPRVTGAAGTRVRRWRARPLGGQLPGWVTALGVLGGVLVWGGGMKFKVDVRRNKQAETKSFSPAPVVSEIVWSPEPSELVAAVRAG